VASYLDSARAAAAGTTPGALITSVAPGGPAAAAGLQAGDIVTSVNGIAIDAGHPLDPASLGLSPGDTAEVTVVRGTTTDTIAVQVGRAS
jgi:serine protease Do